MTIAKYESFHNLFRMASTHLSLASTHRPFTAFFLIITTIFTVPFLALSTSVDELLPSALPSVAYTLWDSLLVILTSSPFYFFLLNFLIAALVLLSGVFNPSSSRRRREYDDPQEGDLHQRGNYSYSAAQIIHERLAFDELYGSQASSLPHLNVTESSRDYAADDGVVEHGYGYEDEDVMGKHRITDSIASFLLQRPAFSEMQGSDDSLPLRAVQEESSSSSLKSMRMEEIEESLVEDSTARGDYYSQVKKTSSVYSVGENGETVTLHNAKDIQVYDDDQHRGTDVDACMEDFDDRGDGCADVMDDANESDDDVIGNNDDGDIDIEDACHVTEEVEDADDNRIQWTPSRQSIADTIHYEKHENVGKDMGSFSEDVRARSIPLIDEGEQRSNRDSHKELKEGGSQDDVSKTSPSSSVFTQKGKAGGEEEGEEDMSAEELNERASAFITAFRKKLISTAID
eukprot:c23300_g1_i1 orf=314-1690(-)